MVNPLDEYPRNFTGHLRATLRDGTTREHRQPHMRGGAHAPMTDPELEQKFMDNAQHGGWSPVTADRFRRYARHVFAQPSLTGLKEFRE